MGFFDFLKKSSAPATPAEPTFPLTLAADAKGTVVAMENIPDEVFAQGILGKCCGIEPTEGKVFAPVDGEITQAPDSGHALGIMGVGGVEVLIHVGVDTVEMKGDGFSPKVKEGDKVKKGDLLLEMDLDKIAAAGHPAVVITVVTNTDDFKDVEVVASGDVEPGAGHAAVPLHQNPAQAADSGGRAAHCGAYHGSVPGLRLPRVHNDRELQKGHDQVLFWRAGKGLPRGFCR